MCLKCLATRVVTMISLICFVFGLLLCGSNAEVHTTNLFKQQINNLKNDLLQQNWTKQEEQCLSATVNILHNVLNQTLWAARVWDSNQIPFGVLYGSKFQLGNYDDCLDVPWADSHPALRTQYCMVELQFINEPAIVIEPDPYTHLTTYMKSIKEVRFNKLSWGVCVPVKCHPKSVEKIVRSLLKNSYLGFLEPQTNATVELCQDDPNPAFTDSFLILIYVVSFVVISILVASAYYHIHKEQHFKGKEILKCLSVTENTAKLLPYHLDEFKTLHGMRCIISFISVFGHIYFINSFTGFSNALYKVKVFERNKLHFLSHGDIIMDMSFTVSGFLLMKILLATQKSFTPLKVIVIRYLRFAPSLLLVLMISMESMKNVLEGPMKSKMLPEKISCEKNWWLNMITLQNYVDPTNMCISITWTIPVDYHLTIFCTLLFWVYIKHPKSAKLLYILALIASVIWPAIETYRLRLPPVLKVDIESNRDYRSNLLRMPTYIASHLRAAPYLIGFAFGYFSRYYKPQQRPIIHSKMVSTILFTASVITLYTVAYIGGSYFIFKDFSAIEGALFAGLNRPLCSLCTVAIILACEYGDVPVVSAILSCTFCTIVSKLGYLIFLLHQLIISRIVITTRNPIQFEITLWLLDLVQVGVLSIISAYLIWLFYEKPISNLISVLIRNTLNIKNSEDTVTKTTTKEKLHNSMEMNSKELSQGKDKKTM